MSIFKRFKEKPVQAKTREKFENADKPIRKTAEDEVDWIHHNVIHHIDHALPDVTTAQGSYFEVTSTDFEGVVEECIKLLPQISFSSVDADIFDDKIMTQTVIVGTPLEETRSINKRNAIGTRTDKEMHLADEECRARRLERAREKRYEELEILISKR